MIDIFTTIVHLCASCANGANTIPGAAGALGGAAGTVGGLEGMGLGSDGGRGVGNEAAGNAVGAGGGGRSSGFVTGNQGDGGGQGSMGGGGPAQSIELPPVEMTVYPGGWLEWPNGDGTISTESPSGKRWTGPDYQPGDPEVTDPNAPQVINLPPVEETLHPDGWIESPNRDGTITHESPTGESWTGPGRQPDNPLVADPNAP
jgi:hypothetical protein